MLEYLFFIFSVLIVGSGLQVLGLSSSWFLLLLAVLSLPSLYAMLTGAPFVPTDRVTIQRMLAISLIKEGEKAVDLGCGDGRLVRAAHALGARAVGYEFSIFLFCVARILSKGQGRIVYKNFWKADFSDVDVLFCYQLPRFEKRFIQTIWPQLKPGCRIVVNTFSLRSLEPVLTDGHVYLYVKNYA
jgi:SAM-dependent methyltransferase